MEELQKTISLQCVFCCSKEFAVPYKDYSPHHGSFVVCVNCGRENDFTSLMFVAKEKAIDIANALANEMIKDMKKELQNIFRGNKYIKIK